MDTKELGNLGERLTCEYLEGKGYDILAKNYKVKFGEIDIIARKKSSFFGKSDTTIHFVEVKTILNHDPSTDSTGSLQAGSGQSGFFPEERINHKKRLKLRRLCQIWLSKNQLSQNYPYQIDVAGIMVSLSTRNARLCYFFNAVAEN